MFSMLRQAYYYGVAMRRLPYNAVACPHCGTFDESPFLKMDRYLLPVHVAMCRECGLIYTSRNFSGEALHAFYRDHYRRFYENATVIGNDYLFTHKPKLIAAYRLERIREVVGNFSHVLEIGSGLGFFLDACRAAGAKVRGFELGDHFRAYSHQQLGLHDQVTDTRFETLDTVTPATDLMVLFHVFEHLEDPVGFLRWAVKQLAPNGTLVIEVPDITGDWAAIGLGQFHTAHRTYFTPTTLSNMLATNGFAPYFITRDSGDGIYPGNMRIFARVGDAGASYPLKPDARAPMLALIRSRLRRKDYLRAARRLLMQAWRGRKR